MHLQEVGWGRGEHQVSQYFRVCACSCPVSISDGTINLYVSTGFWKCWCWSVKTATYFPCSPSKTPDNNESLYFQSFKKSSLFADSVLQTTSRGRRGRDFEFHFIHETASETWNDSTWVHMASKPHHPPRSLGKKERKNSLLKYLKNILKIESNLSQNVLMTRDQGMRRIKALCSPF